MTEISKEALEIAGNWQWQSYNPERVAQRAIDWRDSLLDTFAKGVEGIADRAGMSDEWVAEQKERFRSKLMGLWGQYVAANGNCASPVITGPAAFPVARTEKARERVERLYEEMRTLLERALASCKRKAFPYGDTEAGDAIRSADPDAIAKLKRELAKAEEAHKFGLLANRVYRKEGIEGLRKIGWPEEKIETAERFKLQGYPYTPYFDNNGSARIRRLKQRIAELEARKATPAKSVNIGGVEVRENTGIMRIQIVFPAKPSREIIQLLKRNGFRWAPSQGAWQRHLNNAGIAAAHRVMQALKEQPVKEDI